MGLRTRGTEGLRQLREWTEQSVPGTGRVLGPQEGVLGGRPRKGATTGGCVSAGS